MKDLTSHKIFHGFVPTFEHIESLVFDTAFPIERANRTMQIFRAGMDTGGSASDSDIWTRTEEFGGPNTSWIDQGIEYDKRTGRVIAYHFTDPDGWGGVDKVCYSAILLPLLTA